MSEKNPLYGDRIKKPGSAQAWINAAGQGGPSAASQLKKSFCLQSDDYAVIQQKVLPALAIAKKNAKGEALSVSFSEYIRSLIEADLQERGLK